MSLRRQFNSVLCYKMKRCKNCGSQIRKWRTEGLSGDTCDCESSHTIDQYPDDLKTRELRLSIIKKIKFNPNEREWMELEEGGHVPKRRESLARIL